MRSIWPKSTKPRLIVIFSLSGARWGGAGAFKGGRHIVFPEHTPLTNLQLTLLNKLGVPAEKLGDSTGQFKELSELG